MTASILLFTRPADDTSAKSRLRAKISHTIVNALHRAFVLDSLFLLSEFPETNRYIAWSQEPGPDLLIQKACSNMTTFLQEGSTFGERFNHALKTTLHESNSSGTIIIGSDTPFLNKKLLRQAIECVENERAVIGPSPKNGFYLLGIPSKELQTINFSKDFLVPETESQRIISKLPNIHLLPTQYDIDTLEDYQKLRRDLNLAGMGSGSNLSKFVFEAEHSQKAEMIS